VEQLGKVQTKRGVGKTRGVFIEFRKREPTGVFVKGYAILGTKDGLGPSRAKARR